MAFCDFAVKYDPEVDTPETLTRKIFASVIVYGRMKANKPVIIGLFGDSGEGKSYGSLRFEEILCEIQNIDFLNCIEVMNVITPLEYSEKLDKILFDPNYKKLNMICIHEARTVVKAKMWHSFLAQSVADINAMSRRIKPLSIFIIAQFIRDITPDVRYTLNYYIKVRRPKGKKARLYINVIWKDDRDLEKPKIRKRKLSGYLIYPNGRWRRYVPEYLEITKPSKDIREVFDKIDYDGKAAIIKSKMNKLMNEMKSEAGVASKKVETMIDYYSSNVSSISLIGKRYRGKWRIKPEAVAMHDLTREESKRFEDGLNNVLKDRGVIDE